MTELVLLILVFLGTAIGFLVVNLFVGRLFRSAKPNAEKGKVYECGEPAVGSSWIQFDLRFYVVALLFVVFDVEMAFFFPWATVFGTANKVGDDEQPPEIRAALIADMGEKPPAELTPEHSAAARQIARLAFIDILVFFGVLLVGFAYLWKRGDLEWVRSVAGQHGPGGERWA